MHLILGSSSIYRKKLLERLEFAFDVVPPNLDEEVEKKEILKCGMSPQGLAEALAERKAKNVQQIIHSNRQFAFLAERVNLVIGSDQLLFFDGVFLGKPLTVSKACEMLRLLQGREHLLITSVALVETKDGRTQTWSEVARMKMRQLSQFEIKQYVELDHPLNSAGSYKIESYGIRLFEEIKCSDWTAIEGLPLLSLGKTIRQWN